MTALILHPHTISDLTLTSVRRNNVLKLAQSFPRTKSSKFNNKKQQQQKIHHRIHKDKGNTMV